MLLKDIVEKVSNRMLRQLETGDLAELRRMDGSNPWPIGG
jgi:hypothetical protein